MSSLSDTVFLCFPYTLHVTVKYCIHSSCTCNPEYRLLHIVGLIECVGLMLLI